MSEIVSYSQSENIATITMDDGKANALSPAMLEQLGAAFDRAETDGSKAVVLAGREGKFSAGFDLKIIMQGPKAATELIGLGGELFLRLYELRLPLVAACTGHAVAGGVLLLATADTRIGARGPFKLGLNEVSIGVPIPILAHEFARDRLLPTEMVASIVQAKMYDPEAAAVAGWLDRVADSGDVIAEATAEAQRLAKLPARPYAISKRSLRRETIRYIRENAEANLAELMAGMGQ